MPTLPTTPPAVSLLSDIPNRATQSGAAFSNAADTTMSELNPMGVSQNTLASWQQATATQVYNNALEAAGSAADAAASSALTSYRGLWSAQTGSATKGQSVSHIGAYWALNVNLSNIALSEPSFTNADWQFVSGTRWQATLTTSGSLGKNAMWAIRATSGAVDRTLPAMTDGDFIVIHNDPTSTQTVRVLNAGYNIRSAVRTITSSDNIVLAAGETIYLQSRSSTELRVIR